MFTLHVRWIEEDYIEFANAHRDFVDAVEDYREHRRKRRGRDREDDEEDRQPRRPWEGDGDNDQRPRHEPRRPRSGPGWPVVLLVVVVVSLAAITPCLCLLPFAKIQNGAPQQNQPGWPKQPPGPPKWR
jgi:hypothetical protein